jgi:hypothetical protein
VSKGNAREIGLGAYEQPDMERVFFNTEDTEDTEEKRGEIRQRGPALHGQ